MKSAKTPAKVRTKARLLADVPPEIEWFRNIRNRHTKCAYQNAIKDFMVFTGIQRPEKFGS
jgi:integrase/recombinase XerD